ncbi:MAG: trigger factor [Paracoccaceae bacterium]
MPALDAFGGTWTLEREIEDYRSGATGGLTGQAVFAPDAHGAMLYEEDGTLRLGAQPPMRATRRYSWASGADGITVFFEDGRLFHTIAADQARPEARHDCAPDLYLVSYDFSRWPAWSATWRVTGPAKDYRMVSRYSRVDPGSAQG